jgi:uncharacterized protein (DUF2252 family)
VDLRQDEDRRLPPLADRRNTVASTDVTGSVFDAVLRFVEGHSRSLVRLKLERMDVDAFTFFRGADHLFAAAWPELRPPDVGPSILICGDLHLENFGAYRTDAGDFLFDINDFDEALVAPCSLDLVRCTTSILLAAQVWELTPVQAMRTVLAFLDRYRITVTKAARSGRVREISLRTGRGPIRELLGRTALGDQPKLLDRHTRRKKSGLRRIIRSPELHPDVDNAEAASVAEAIEALGHRRGEAESYRVLDVTGRVAGIGSLGLRRYTILVVGEGSPDQNRLLDVKEERPSALLPCAEEPQALSWEDEAVRVVEAQRQLSARPVACLDALEMGDVPFRVREMIPAENRSRLDRLRESPAKLRRAVEVAGRLTGWAHIRGCRIGAEDRTKRLADWVAGPAVDAVLAPAVRYAERTRTDYKAFHKDYARRGLTDGKGD